MAAEPACHSLYSRLEQVLGAEHAETLMTYLPTHGTDHVVTKGDISRVGQRFDHLENRFDNLERRFDRLEDRLTQRLDQAQQTYVVTTVGSLTALTAIFSLIVTVFG